MEKEVFKFTGNAAHNYEKYRGPFMFEPYAEEIVKHIKPFKINRALEIAAGTGRVTKHLRNTLDPATKIYASDISPDMLDIAEEVAGHNNVEYEVVDAHNLPYEDNHFELAVCQFGLMFFKNKTKALSEIYRVLKPGGQFLFSTWDRTEYTPLFNLVYDKHIIPFFAHENPQKFKLPFSLFEEEHLRALLADAGFEKVAVQTIVKAATAISAKHLVDAFIFRHTIGDEMAHADPDRLSRLEKDLEQDIARMFGNTPVKCYLRAIICEAYK